MASANAMRRIANQPQFQLNVSYYAFKAAVAVMAEAANTPSHTERVAYAKKVLDGSASMALYAAAIVTNATLTVEGNPDAEPNFGVPDGDLEFTVNSLFNAMAGVALA